MKQKIMAILLGLLLVLSACSAKPADTSGSAPQTDGSAASSCPSNGTAQPQEPEEPVIDLTLRYQSLPLPNGMGAAQGQCYQHGRVYSYGNDRGAAVGYTLVDGTTGMLELPAEEEYVHAICAAENSLAVLAGSFPMFYTDAEGEFQESSVIGGAYEILLYDEEGALSARVPLQNLYKEQTDTFFDMAYLDGSYYLLAPHRVTCIGADGEELARTLLDTERCYHSITSCGETLVLGMGSVTEMDELAQLDAQTLEETASFLLEGKTLTGVGEDADGNLLVCDRENTVRRVDWDAQEGEKVLSWTENGGTAAQNYVRFYERSGLWLALEADTQSVNVYHIFDGAPPEKIKLTLTQVGSSMELQRIVTNFNRASDVYEVELIPASDNFDNDRPRILAELTTNPTDLYAGWLDRELPLASGAFADLSPWFTADREVYDGLLPNLRDLLVTGGACYSLPYQFQFFTYLGTAEDFEHGGLSIDEMERITERAGYAYPLDGLFSAELQLDDLAALSPSYFVDFENASCRFTDAEFIRMLELCKLAGATIKDPNNPEAVTLGTYYADCATRRVFVQNAETIPTEMYRYIEEGSYQSRTYSDFTYVGYPNSVSNGCAFVPELYFAVSAQTEHMEGAWEFIRYALSYQEQHRSLFFPVNEAALRDKIDEYAANHSKLKQPYIDRLLDAVYGTTCLFNAGSETSRIVKDEGMGYLNDQLTAEQAAERIQSRVGLYLMEQYG